MALNVPAASSVETQILQSQRQDSKGEAAPFEVWLFSPSKHFRGEDLGTNSNSGWKSAPRMVCLNTLASRKCPSFLEFSPKTLEYDLNLKWVFFVSIYIDSAGICCKKGKEQVASTLLLVSFSLPGTGFNTILSTLYTFYQNGDDTSILWEESSDADLLLKQPLSSVVVADAPQGCCISLNRS
ncbi:hypothetical protein TNCV_3545691 [Trichonephila clavipes]|nr:hypothetical protein TNCV_3545691 [Trichonephila clavipes]